LKNVDNQIKLHNKKCAKLNFKTAHLASGMSYFQGFQRSFPKEGNREIDSIKKKLKIIIFTYWIGILRSNVARHICKKDGQIEPLVEFGCLMGVSVPQRKKIIYIFLSL
jgi:hypothetical protein